MVRSPVLCQSLTSHHHSDSVDERCVPCRRKRHRARKHGGPCGCDSVCLVVAPWGSIQRWGTDAESCHDEAVRCCFQANKHNNNKINIIIIHHHHCHRPSPREMSFVFKKQNQYHTTNKTTHSVSMSTTKQAKTWTSFRWCVAMSEDLTGQTTPRRAEPR